jgi:hypothetical protein
MTLMRHLPKDEALHTPDAAWLVFDTWRTGAVVARWLTRHVAATSHATDQDGTAAPRRETGREAGVALT